MSIMTLVRRCLRSLFSQRPVLARHLLSRFLTQQCSREDAPFLSLYHSLALIQGLSKIQQHLSNNLQTHTLTMPPERPRPAPAKRRPLLPATQTRRIRISTFHNLNSMSWPTYLTFFSLIKNRLFHQVLIDRSDQPNGT